MSKKSIRLISIILTIAVVLMMLSTVTFAASPKDYTTGGKDLTNGKIGDIGKNIISTISTVAMIISVIVLMILGIKYMMGSAEEKASYKKTMVPYVVGAVLVFGAGAVADMVYTFAGSIK